MKKIAIVGTAPLSRDMTPHDDASWDIWVCSPGNMGMTKRISVFFELHAMVELEAAENQGWAKNYLAWLRQQTFPVMMQEPNEHVPQAKVFPYKAMIKEFGREWFSSSIAWMQAYAIAHMSEGDEIAIFGVDMAADQEHYTAQRSGCRRFIEIAKDRGIKTTIPWESCLGNPPPLYGYSESTPLGRRINVTKAMLVQRHNEIKALIDKTRLEECFFAGAMEQLNYIQRTFVDGENATLDVDPGLLEHLSGAAKAYAEREIIPKLPLSVGDGSAELKSAGLSTAMTSNLRPPPPVKGTNGASHPSEHIIPITEKGSPELPGNNWDG